MKTKKYITIRLAYLLPILLLAICISCSNNDSDERNNNNYDNPSIPVNINVDGVIWGDETTMTRGMMDEIKETVIPINDELEIVAKFEPDYETISKTRGTTSLGQNVAYRVIAYKQNGAGKASDYVAHADFKVGTPPDPDKPFMLPWGCAYDIVCYSNGTGTLGTFDKEIYEYVYGAGEMPLYCKTTLTIPTNTETIPLNITLKHADSMVKVIVKDETNKLSIAGVSGVTTGAHYNTMKMKLSNGHRNNPGGTSSSRSVTMKAPSSDANNQCESDYVAIFSHDDALSTPPFVNIETIKLKNDMGKEFTISNKRLSALSNWTSGSRYKATFVLKTTNEYAITASAVEDNYNSSFVNIKLTNISGGNTTENPAQSVTFTGMLGSHATASYEYKTGENASINHLKHYLFSRWEVKKNTGNWVSYSTEPTILLEPSKEKENYKYRAYFTPDNRTIIYNWKVEGFGINGKTVTERFKNDGSFTMQAYQALYNFCTVSNTGGNTTSGSYFLVIGSMLKNGWATVYQANYGMNTGWGLGCNDDEFVPFDNLPGNNPDTRTHEIRIYVAFANKPFKVPQNSAEWENFDTWISNNN